MSPIEALKREKFTEKKEKKKEGRPSSEKGMIQAGNVYFLDNSQGEKGEKVDRKKESSIKESLLNSFFPDKSLDGLNLRASLEALVGDSCVEWDDIEKISKNGKRRDVIALTKEYLINLRATDSQKKTRMKECLDEFRSLVNY